MINAPKTIQTSYAPARPLVLVADDHEDTRLLYRTVIETRGYFVIEAADGEETVRNAESARPDLILMDGSLPRMSGLDALGRYAARQTSVMCRLSLSPATLEQSFSHSPTKQGVTSTS